MIIAYHMCIYIYIIIYNYISLHFAGDPFKSPACHSSTKSYFSRLMRAHPSVHLHWRTQWAKNWTWMKYVQLGHDDRRTCDSYTYGKDPVAFREGKPMPHPQPQVIGMFGCQKTNKKPTKNQQTTNKPPTNHQQTTNPPLFPVPGSRSMPGLRWGDQHLAHGLRVLGTPGSPGWSHGQPWWASRGCILRGCLILGCFYFFNHILWEKCME